MLQVGHYAQSSRPSNKEVTLVPQVDALGLLRIFYRKWPIIAGAVGITSGLGLAYTLVATPKYTATTLVYIDPNTQHFISKQELNVNGGQPDPGIIDSQVEILKSENVLGAAVRALDLISDPEFTPPKSFVGSAISWVLSLVSRKAPPPSQADIERGAAEKILAGLKVKRLGLTYVVQIDYTDLTPRIAARIANGVGEAFSAAELEARFQSAKRASRWLDTRIKELRDQAADADRKVQNFKADNNLVDTARGSLNEQQLADVNTQVVTARAATAEAKARYDRVLEVLNDPLADGSVTEALRSEVITRLRAQFLDLSAKHGEIAKRYGARHGAAVNLINQMEEVKSSIQLELKRIAESSRSDYEVAAEREKSIGDSLKAAVSQADANNLALVKLRDLESTAQIYRGLYDTLSQKFEEATQQQSYPALDARIITPAAEPSAPSWPRSVIVVPAAIIIGLALGMIAALLREFLGNNFRSIDDVQNYAGFECLGILPDLSYEHKERKFVSHDTTLLGASASYARHAVESPFSRFTETIRNVKVTLDIARSQETSGVIGIVSSVPKEGKTTVSANLAFLVAQMGHKTLLIDGDLHNPSITRTLVSGVGAGLIEVLTQVVPLEEVVRRDSVTGLDFVPTVINARHSNVVALLTSRAMMQLLTEARKRYEYVIIDLPPAVPVVDVKAAAHMVDNFIFVIEWGVTSRDVVREALESADLMRSKVLGVVLNKADPAELKRFEAYKGGNYNSYYVAN